MIFILVAADMLMALTFLLRMKSLPPQIPLYYSKAVGDDQLGDTWMIFIIPTLMTILFAVNNLIYKKYFLGQEMVKRIFNYLNIFLVVSFTIIFIRILYLIT